MQQGLTYRAGGNPPANPSLWLGERRLAFWPAGRVPTNEEAVRVERAYWLGGAVTLSPSDVLAIIDAYAMPDGRPVL